MEDVESCPVAECEPLNSESAPQDPKTEGVGSSPGDFMLCDTGSRLVPRGFTRPPSNVVWCGDLKLKYSEEQTKRRKLFNQLEETKGNNRVFCRRRPLSKEEVSAGCSVVADFEAAKEGDLAILTGGSTKKTFRFDKVFTPKDDQVDVFADASPLVVSALDGYNVCIFAYGQTGTGKTFTMEGTEQNRGVNYRTLEQLFRIAEERSETFAYSISVSVLEVYNEQIRDLLATSPTSKKLEIKQAPEGLHL